MKKKKKSKHQESLASTCKTTADESKPTISEEILAPEKDSDESAFMRFYKNHKHELDEIWKEDILQKVKEVGLGEDECWTFRAKNANAIQGGYWRMSLRKFTSKWEWGSKGFHNGKKRYGWKRVYKSHEFLLHHLALANQGKELISKMKSSGGDTILIDVSHICQIASCFNPRHLVLESRSANLSRIGCFSDICLHIPNCLLTRRAYEEKVRLRTVNMYIKNLPIIDSL